jgi:hypothetical protein
MRDRRFRLTTAFFERVYAPVMLLASVLLALGMVVWLAMSI